MKKFRTILALIGALLLVLAISSLPANADEDIVYYGSCGDNVTWTLDKEGKLIIEGSGPIAFDSVFEVHGQQHLLLSNWVGSPWGKIPDAKILMLEIKEGVTAIPYRAFNGLNDLTTVKIADSVTSIGLEAFYAIDSLESVKFGSGLQTIGRAAFRYCISLFEIDLPNGLKQIEGDAFSSCYALNTVRIPASVEEIGTDAFDFCSKLSTVILESPTIAAAAEDHTAIGDLLCHPREIRVAKSITTLGKQFKDHYAAKGTVSSNGISYTRYLYQTDSGKEWYYDTQTHFVECHLEDCHAIIESQPHVWDNPCDETCNVCRYYSEKSHVEHTVAVNGGHQTVCKNCQLPLSSVAPHNFGDECWGEECYDCGQTRQAPGHDFTPWQTDAWEHQRECTRCHWVEKGAHSGDDPCAVCGREADSPCSMNDHAWYDTFQYDEHYHWRGCSRCNTIQGKTQHSWGEGVVTFEPTATQAGEMLYTCTECTCVKAERIAPLEGPVTEPPVTENTPATDDQPTLIPPQSSAPSSENEPVELKPEFRIVWADWALPAVIGGVLLAAGGAFLLLIWRKKKKS